MCIERELLRDDERRDEDDAHAAVRGEPAGEIERVIRLLASEERDDDRAVAHGRGAAREALRAAADGWDVRPAHQRSWNGTLARMTPGSTRRRRLT